jgi:hypothetical protein
VRLLRKIFRLLGWLAALGGSSAVFAEEVRREWTTIPQADHYEYQISSVESFAKSTLEKDGRTEKPELTVSLPPGRYYLRIRAVDEAGPGEWSSTEVFFVEGGALKLVEPSKGKVLSISGPDSKIGLRWEGGSDEEDYELQLKHLRNDEKKTRVLISKDRKVLVNGWEPGLWQAVVSSRKNGQVHLKSLPLEFEIKKMEFADPVIQSPRDGAQLSSMDATPVRWVRRIPGSHSDILVRRMDEWGSVLSRIEVNGSQATEIPALPPGVYQLTVKDSTDELDQFVQSTVTVVVKDPVESAKSAEQENPLSFRFRFSDLWGSTRYKNDSLTDGIVFSNRGNATPELQLGVSGRVGAAWDFDALYGFSFPSLKIKNPFNPNNEDYGINGSAVENHTSLVFGRDLSPWGESLPTRIRLGLSLHRRKTALEFSDNLMVPPFREASDSVINQLGFVVGGSLAGMAWGRYWTMKGTLEADFPYFSWGKEFGTGWPVFYSPEVTFRLEGIRKLNSDWTFTVGPTLRFGRLIFGEKNRSQKTTESILLYGISLGFTSNVL